jgi:hypothetical protein
VDAGLGGSDVEGGMEPAKPTKTSATTQLDRRAARECLASVRAPVLDREASSRYRIA